MNKVIRTARISDHTVVLPIQVNSDTMDLSEMEGEDAVADVVDVEAIVQERLQEAEVRFQEEKEAAVQASFEEGKAQGIEEGHAQGFEEGKAQGIEEGHAQGFEEGKAQGDQEGHARGLAEGQAQSYNEIVRLQSLLGELNARWGDLFKTADHDLTELAMTIARNVVGSLVDVHRDLVLEVVRDCLGHLQDRSRIVIRIHPYDLELVRSHREEWQDAFEQIESLIIETDESIGHGGCLIETPAGDIDAQIESRLDKLKTALLEVVQNAPTEHSSDQSNDDVGFENLQFESQSVDESAALEDDNRNVEDLDEGQTPEIEGVSEDVQTGLEDENAEAMQNEIAEEEDQPIDLANETAAEGVDDLEAAAAGEDPVETRQDEVEET